MAINVPLITDGRQMYKQLERLKKYIRVGDQVWLPQENVGIEHDGMFIDGFWFVVVEKYDSHVVLERPLKRYGIHRQSATYYDIYKFGKLRREEKSWHRGKAKWASR